MTRATFNNKNNEFFQSLKADVDNYFETNRIKKTGNWKLYTKTFVLIGIALALYGSLLFVPMNGWAALAAAALLGLVCAGVGFSIMHDACHGSYSTKNWVNELLGLSLNCLGASSFFWKQKHNIIHHTYTNIDGIDDDIAKSPIIRQCESQKWVPAHKVQHLYLPFIYSLTVIFWLYFMDFTKYFTRRIYTTEAWKMSTRNHIVFWLTKICYVSFYIVIPFLVWGWWALLGYLVLNMFLGLTISIIFQLAHVVENTEFEHIPLDTSKHIETAWAEHQLKTTSNFAMKNKFISWYVGGLNFQVEHHLFPKISHVHYPAISQIVRQKCQEFNMPYNYYDTLSAAIASHFRIMKVLGQAPGNVVTATRVAA
jgi:linoleoyl-CoA desaturase